MGNRPYNAAKYDRDIQLLQSASTLNSGFCTSPDGLARRKRILKEFGYTNLRVLGGAERIDNITDPRYINRAFENTVNDARKRVALHGAYVESLHPAVPTLHRIEEALQSGDTDSIDALAERFAMQTENLAENDPLVLRYNAMRRN